MIDHLLVAWSESQKDGDVSEMYIANKLLSVQFHNFIKDNLVPMVESSMQSASDLGGEGTCVSLFMLDAQSHIKLQGDHCVCKLGGRLVLN